MPNRKKRVVRRRRRSRGFARTRSSMMSSQTPVDVASVVRAVTAISEKVTRPFEKKEEVKKLMDDGFLIVRKASSLESKESLLRDLPEIRLLRNIFKADHPYRTTLALMAAFNSSAAGVVNLQLQVGASLTSTSEWSSIDALFDEFFIHSVKVIFVPRNKTTSGSGTTAVQINTGATGSAPVNSSVGLIWVSTQNAISFYSGAQGMANNPSHKYTHSSEPSTYMWRNVVKFEPHGYTLNLPSSSGWQGWSLITSAANYGGAIQARAVNDVVVGDTTHVWTLGDVCYEWDISFRSRA